MRTFLALFLLSASASAQVHLCGNALCNGSTVISHPQPPGTKVLGFRVTSSGDRVVYVSNSNCRRELYSVATSGVLEFKLSDFPGVTVEPCFRNVTDEFYISPDDLWVSWEADRDVTTAPAKGDQDYELFTTPILGDWQHMGGTVQLNPPLVFDNDVEQHQWSCDSLRVVYRQGKDSANRWELFSALARVPNSGQRISQVMGMSQAVGDFKVHCNGEVNYRADLTQSGVYTGFRTTVVPGGRIWTEIMSDGFESGTTGGWR